MPKKAIFHRCICSMFTLIKYILKIGFFSTLDSHIISNMPKVHSELYIHILMPQATKQNKPPKLALDLFLWLEK